jgi:hypothetical protein
MLKEIDELGTLAFRTKQVYAGNLSYCQSICRTPLTLFSYLPPTKIIRLNNNREEN